MEELTLFENGQVYKVTIQGDDHDDSTQTFKRVTRVESFAERVQSLLQFGKRGGGGGPLPPG